MAVGHFNAAKSIYEHISENYKFISDTKSNINEPIEIEMIDCVKYVSKTIEKVTSTAYKLTSENMPWVWGKVYEDSKKKTLAHLTSKSNMVLAIKLLKLIREKNPDLIISTHPFGTQMCNYLKRKNKINATLATVMTDFIIHDQWLVGHNNTNYFFVAHDEMKNDLIQKRCR